MKQRGEFDVAGLIFALNKMKEIDEVSREAGSKAAQVIKREQQRIFAKARFRRDRKSHKYKFPPPGVIKQFWRPWGQHRVVFKVGFPADVIKRYPELLCVEFGRPGIYYNGDNGKETDKRGRVIGKFPRMAVTMPIRTGFLLAKEEALNVYRDVMFNRISEDFTGKSDDEVVRRNYLEDDDVML